MQYEGIKETQNTRIEKDKETLDEIEMLYSFGVVLFEHAILESEHKTYSISYFAPQQIYDIVIENKQENKLETYTTTTQLTGNMEKMFQLNKNEKIIINNEEITCTSHSIEHTL
ncbi:MAG: hypothetical protein IJI98_02825 [Methanosphaera sp.]|nr:hypothetical protein [Methanosphaera sp.]